jgi:hypothetical protein
MVFSPSYLQHRQLGRPRVPTTEHEASHLDGIPHSSWKPISLRVQVTPSPTAQRHLHPTPTRQPDRLYQHNGRTVQPANVAEWWMVAKTKAKSFAISWQPTATVPATTAQVPFALRVRAPSSRLKSKPWRVGSHMMPPGTAMQDSASQSGIHNMTHTTRRS